MADQSRKLMIHFPEDFFRGADKDDLYDTKLCMSFGVAHLDRRHHNVIAYQGPVAPATEIAWEDDWHVAATKTSFTNGATITVATEIMKTECGHKFILPADWTDLKLEADPNAPPTGFIFSNETTERVSAVLYKTVNGSVVPIFHSPHPVFSKGQETITPIESISIWLQSGAETGNMVDLETSKVSVLDQGGNQQLHVSWNGSEFLPQS